MAFVKEPDIIPEEERQYFADTAVFPETVDVNIRQLDPIPAPRVFLRSR
ncbi:MAG: 3-deoxy-7-phosphoheptulonate synthase, partial [Bifidobacterium sp.]|nr:3-deoxy-7-phosphoheptulonate synthase [Bifidobacterium sp.]